MNYLFSYDVDIDGIGSIQSLWDTLYIWYMLPVWLPHNAKYNTEFLQAKISQHGVCWIVKYSCISISHTGISYLYEPLNELCKFMKISRKKILDSFQNMKLIYHQKYYPTVCINYLGSGILRHMKMTVAVCRTDAKIRSSTNNYENNYFYLSSSW